MLIHPAMKRPVRTRMLRLCENYLVDLIGLFPYLVKKQRVGIIHVLRTRYQSRSNVVAS